MCPTNSFLISLGVEIYTSGHRRWPDEANAPAVADILDALEQAIHQRGPAQYQLVHHSDRGSQYLSIKCTERLAEAKIAPSVGSVGDSYDTTLAETIDGLFKAGVIHRRGPWRSFDAVEYATLEAAEWFSVETDLNPSDLVLARR